MAEKKTMFADQCDHELNYGFVGGRGSICIKCSKQFTQDESEKIEIDQQQTAWLNQLHNLDRDKVHVLKCIQPFFDDVWEGKKEFEVRNDDRGYKEEDVVLLREYIPLDHVYTGKYITATITYLIRGTVCLKEGYCAFGINLIYKGENYDGKC